MSEDASLPLVMAAAWTCVRKLKRGECLRYMRDAARPLVGYAIACPSCGFVELHQHATARFLEVDGAPRGHDGPLSCMACKRAIVIAPLGDVVMVSAVSDAR